MINVRVITNTERFSKIIDENDSVKSLLESLDVDYTLTTTTVDGAPLGTGEINKSFKDLGCAERVTVACIVKADNA